MAQLKDLVITGATRIIGPLLVSKSMRIGKAVFTYNATDNAIVISFIE